MTRALYDCLAIPLTPGFPQVRLTGRGFLPALDYRAKPLHPREGKVQKDVFQVRAHLKNIFLHLKPFLLWGGALREKIPVDLLSISGYTMVGGHSRSFNEEKAK